MSILSWLIAATDPATADEWQQITGIRNVVDAWPERVEDGFALVRVSVDNPALRELRIATEESQ